MDSFISESGQNISPNDIKTIGECEKNRQKCYEHNIKPIMDEIKDLKDDFKSFKVEFQDFKADLKEIVAVIPYKVFEKTINEADKKYATKLTQKIVYGLVTTVLISFISGLIALVII